jgi:hypothetical protein
MQDIGAKSEQLLKPNSLVSLNEPTVGELEKKQKRGIIISNKLFLILSL